MAGTSTALCDHDARFLVLEPIACGSMGCVSKAYDRSLGRIIAVKTVPPEIRQPNLAIAALSHESEILATLRYPHIVQHVELVEDEELALILEFVDGTSVEHLIRDTVVPLCDACRIVRDAALALSHCHERGIVHGDVKPANLIVRPDGRTVLIDFGLACRQGEANDGAGNHTVAGSPSYMAPELFASGRSALGPRTDIYSLGAVLHELLTGRPPVEGELGRLMEHAFGPGIPSVPLGQLPLPYDLRKICGRMLAHNPHRRFSAMMDVVDALERWMAVPRAQFRRVAVENCVARC